jgi:hypothetical protein
MFRRMTVIPPAVAALLELFESALSDLRFADLDASVLSGLSAEVTAAAEGVAAKQAALDEARAALQERQNVLLQQAQRALAYARVYAENDFELRAKLEAIALPKPARAPRRANAEAPAAQPAEASGSSEASEPSSPANDEASSGGNEAADAKPISNAGSRKKKRDGALPATP